MAVFKPITIEYALLCTKWGLALAIVAVLLIASNNTLAECRIRTEASDKFGAMTYYDEGRERLLKDQWGQAIESYTKAIVVDPGFARAYYGRGEAYLLLATNTEGPRFYILAIQDFSRCLKLDPQMSQVRLFRAYSYEKLAKCQNPRDSVDGSHRLWSRRGPGLGTALLTVLKHIHHAHSALLSLLRGNTVVATKTQSACASEPGRTLAHAAAGSITPSTTDVQANRSWIAALCT